jgi:hypothetical protein
MWCKTSLEYSHSLNKSSTDSTLACSSAIPYPAPLESKQLEKETSRKTIILLKSSANLLKMHRLKAKEVLD